MVNDAEFIEKCEGELQQIIQKMHKHGVRFKVIHWLFKETIKDLKTRAIAEKWTDNPKS